MEVKLRRLTYRSRGTSGAPERNHVGLERDYNTIYLQKHYITLPVTSRGIPELLNHCGPVRRWGGERGGGVMTPAGRGVRRTGQQHGGGRGGPEPTDEQSLTHQPQRDGTRGRPGGRMKPNFTPPPPLFVPHSDRPPPRPYWGGRGGPPGGLGQPPPPPPPPLTLSV